ncbi:YaaL family protein [Halalkalibacterium ligniniphilum]|uniref:YaaL family protein n=1 Tax=Halalkalibacterium ligniniphilum TaxID=1134413 RepID=UPI000348BE64|nr:YaaL family protein [Halalkalibacterium ligniniphilum]
MLFQKKRSIRRNEDERLLAMIEEEKRLLESQQCIVSRSVDPSEEVLLRLKMTEMKYLFLLKEARIRKTTKNGRS